LNAARIEPCHGAADGLGTTSVEIGAAAQRDLD
jgi:hypothetical protein